MGVLDDRSVDSKQCLNRSILFEGKLVFRVSPSTFEQSGNQSIKFV